MSKLVSAAIEVHLDEPAFNLVEVNLQAPDNSGWRRYQIISVVRGERLAEYREDLGAAKTSPLMRFVYLAACGMLLLAAWKFCTALESFER